MNRRRMMMQSVQDKPVHTELEVLSGNTLLADIGLRQFYKVNEGLAICALIKRHNTEGVYYREPFLLSEDREAVTFQTKVTYNGTFESELSMDYNGKTYYLSAWRVPLGMEHTKIINPLNLPFLQDITGIDYISTIEGQIQSAVDLLDYYYGKRWQ